jgi:hypothetical protein
MYSTEMTKNLRSNFFKISERNKKIVKVNKGRKIRSGLTCLVLFYSHER